MKLQDKVAVVTGGTRGIGFGIAREFVVEGATVVVNGRSEAKGAQAVEALGGGDGVAFVQADVSSRPDVDRLIDETVGRFGRIDVLVNNAGGSSQLGPITSLTDEGWQGTIDWILNSAFWGMRRALQHMVPQGSGRIINISSTEGKRGFAMASPYSAAKHGLHGLTKSAALEVGVDGITVNAICPGLVATDMTEEAGREAAVAMGITYEQFLDGYAQETAIKRLVTVEEIAALAVLLASDAGGGITGACISIDGGSTPY